MLGSVDGKEVLIKKENFFFNKEVKLLVLIWEMCWRDCYWEFLGFFMIVFEWKFWVFLSVDSVGLKESNFNLMGV